MGKRPIIFVFGLLFLAGLSPGISAQDKATINSIEILQYPPFDSAATLRLINRVANALHVQTKEFVIRRELLFNKGDSVNQALFDETERNLRRLGFLNSVEIRQIRLNDSTVDVSVVTHDSWSLSGGLWYSTNGGIIKYGANVAERNLAGLGQTLGIAYDHQSNRKNPNGYSANYGVPRLFNSTWESSLGYANSEDLRAYAVQIDKPFYTESSKWSAGIHADGGTFKAQEYVNGYASVTHFLDFQSQDIWGVYSTNDGDAKTRLGAAVVRQHYAQDSSFNRRDQHILLANLSAGWVTRTYRKETYLNSLGAVEDVSLGFASSVVAGKDLVTPGLYYFLLQELFSGATGQFFAGSSASVQGYRAQSGFEDVTLSFGAILAQKTHASGVVAANINGTFGSNWNPGAQLYLDSPNSLRGLPAFALSGDRRFVVNIEDRFDNGVSLWHFETGSVFFLDCGSIWSQGQGNLAPRFYKSVGYGIRIMNEGLLGPGVLRLDFAYNIDRHQFEFIFTTGQLFSVFDGVDTASPLSY